MNPITHHPFEFSIGPLHVTGFGIAMVLSFVIAQVICESESSRRGHDPRPIADLVVASVVGGIVGAKVYYAILMGTSLFSRAGFVFWGGLVGGILATWVVMQFKKLPFTRISDIAAPSVAAAYAVGRTGCWAVGDDYGLPYSGPLAVEFPDGAPPSTVANLVSEFGVQFPAGTPPTDVVAVYPTQLFQVGLAFAMFALLWRWRNHKHAEGWLFGVYCALAGCERFVIEFFRAKDDRFFAGLTLAQMIALAFVAAGVLWMRARHSVGAGRPGIHATTPAAS
jgi:phosphatidylglycerol:prolipoprotein diacylglycerol transferase